MARVTHSIRQLRGNGLSHRVVEWASSRPTHLVILLHGYMDAALSWDLVAPALAESGGLVVAPDLRGYGEGARVPGGSGYHFPEYVFDVADIVDDHYERALPLFVVGHSMGGSIATLYSATFPERVRALALLEGLGPPDNPPDVAPIRLRTWIDQSRKVRGFGAPRSMTLDAALARLRENHRNVPDDVLRERLPHLTVPLPEGGVRWAYDPLHKTISPTPFQVALFREFLVKVKCPTLFVSGGPDGYHPPDEDERLAAIAKHERVEIPTAVHMMHWTKPRELSQILVDFTRRALSVATTVAVVALVAACGPAEPKSGKIRVPNDKYTAQPKGCAVQIFDGAPTVATQDIGIVRAHCQNIVSEDDCVRELKDQACELGANVIWGVTADGRADRRPSGRAAHTK